MMTTKPIFDLCGETEGCHFQELLELEEEVRMAAYKIIEAKKATYYGCLLYTSSYEITTDPDAFGEVREALEKEGVPMASAEVTMIPDNYVTLTDPEDIKNLNRTLDLLDEDDDVQAVYHNWEEE